MVKDPESKNRCIIFLYYDKDGLVDRYVTSLLDSLGKVSSYVLAVVNGYLTDEGERELRAHAGDVLIRVNTGFDVGGYREGIFWIGFERLAKFDELVLMNYTFFAPLFPLEEMFREMGGRDIDFWGITKHHAVPVDTTGGRIRYGHIPEHLNSHFLALRRDFFMSFSYRDFIINMKNPISYDASIHEYEAIFTKHFADLGYKWDVYMDTDAYEGVVYAPFMFEGGPLIEARCPIVKRRVFFGDYFSLLANSAGESYSEAYKAVKDRTDYDVTMIWENLLRLQDRNAVRYAIHESYVVDSEVCTEGVDLDEAAVFIIGSETEADLFAGRYLRELPAGVSVRRFNRPGIYADEAGKYKYVCVLHLPEMRTSDPDAGSSCLYGACRPPYSNAVSHFYGDCQSLIGTGCQLANTIRLFQENPELGLLVPPMPTYGSYFETAEDGWYGKYEEVVSAAEKANLTFPILAGEMPPVFPCGGSCWARGEVLSAALRSGLLPEGDDRLAMLLLPYLFQNSGYMTGTVTGTQYAAVLMTNLDFELREHNRMIFRKIQPDAWWKVLDELRR